MNFRSLTENLNLNELTGELRDGITETYASMMKSLRKNQKKKIRNLKRKKNRLENRFLKELEEERMKLKMEEEEMRKSLEEALEKQVETSKELIEMNKREKENRVIVEMIFDIARNWTDIDFWFSQILGMQEVLKSVEENSDEKEHKKGNSAAMIRHRMKKKADLIQRLHDSNIELVEKVLDSLKETLDFVVFGIEETNRNGLSVFLNSMMNIQFLTLDSEQLIDSGINQMKETVFEIRELLFQLPLYQLRPRKSIRQYLWDQIDSFDQSHSICF
uniref:Uncharacterized protein n=1 Tax=Caenorhabditis tropicalis TaxID=1561998 RepID=A0A1I7V0E1_9PELO